MENQNALRKYEGRNYTEGIAGIEMNAGQEAPKHSRGKCSSASYCV
jgi:hypothetical protein